MVSLLKPEQVPSGLSTLKTELVRRGWTAGLLDVFKEADLRLGFTDPFGNVARSDRP